ncbi:malonic semialdehyde reductase RutE [bacterium HR33]|nr:malonic semialdehyde reductase RutE [bacterium HR33]
MDEIANNCLRPPALEVEVHPLIAGRWSPRAFADKPVETEKLRSLFEAARWAPSSYNEQPWRFWVATREDPEALERLQSYLTEGNAWAKSAPVLVLSAYRTHRERDGRPNRVALRDLGAAEQNMAIQAFAMGLVMHQMEGFDRERAKRELLPEGFEPGTMSAIGYLADPETLPERLRERELRPRTRKPLGEIVFPLSGASPALAG